MSESQPAEHRDPRQTALRLVAPWPVVSFVGAFLADVAFAGTHDFLWAGLAVLMLGCGLLSGGLAALAAMFEFARKAQARDQALILIHALGMNSAVLLALANVFVRSREGFGSLMLTGMALSAMTAFVIVATVPFGRYLAARRAFAAAWLAPHRNIAALGQNYRS